MQQLLEKAISIALTAHRGQKDKGGEPYILHPIKVMSSVNTMEEKIVSMLHDVVEDSTITIKQLRKEKFPRKILNAVSLLTKKENQPYDDYINAIKKNALAAEVKKADLRQNMDLTRLKKITESDKARLAKYRRALKLLKK